MSDRCEPPPELRDRDGWHWVQYGDDKPTLVAWQNEGIWLRVPPADCASRPPHMAYLGYRYLSPVATPAEVAALRAERDAAVSAYEAAQDTIKVAWQTLGSLRTEMEALRAERDESIRLTREAEGEIRRLMEIFSAENAQVADLRARVAELEADNARMRGALSDAQLQLEYVQARWPTGTTPTILGRISVALGGTDNER